MQQRSPVAARRKLGAHLRELRGAARLTGTKVAQRLGCAPSTVSKIESGNLVPDSALLDRMLDLYGLEPAAERAAFHRLLDTASGEGWWEQYEDVLPPRFNTYIGLELDALSVTAYETTLVHGLLETRAYAGSLMHAAAFGQRPDDIETLVEVRMRRKENFDREPPLRLSVVMEEAAIRRPVGGPAVMREQLAYLLEAQEKPYINIQILPFSLGAHIGLTGPVALLEFPDDPPVGHAEGTTGNTFLTKPRDTSRCRIILDKLHELALSPAETSAMISAALEELP
ncbi:helix-turn-helix domain-containing protein [Streptomonospora sp. S1-112]|uniref:Helix-turn-helix domain-containing protein n=1 Tax=Streptomonospora mangrovi TaxID=2883123 RepID=A0A9X3SHE4_9ACTN|nr:helix-turn-helix transcriptional regulator [Streptomonospora mangrovi]MDA0565184.1 helix-turn-helix domain-containing protein [Streptomonospora mangrovi]